MSRPDIVHCTDGDEGPAIGFHVEWPDGRWIWCGELTDHRCAEIDEEIKKELHIGNGGGFILEIGDKQQRRTLARLAGMDEALEVVTAVRDACSAEPPTDQECERVARAFEPKLWERIDHDITGTHLAGAARHARASSMDRARAAIIALRGGV